MKGRVTTARDGSGLDLMRPKFDGDQEESRGYTDTETGEINVFEGGSAEGRYSVVRGRGEAGWLGKTLPDVLDDVSSLDDGLYRRDGQDGKEHWVYKRDANVEIRAIPNQQKGFLSRIRGTRFDETMDQASVQFARDVEFAVHQGVGLGEAVALTRTERNTSFVQTGITIIGYMAAFLGAIVTVGRAGRPSMDESTPGRRGAIGEAKRDLGISRSTHPSHTKRNVPMLDKFERKVLGPDGKPIMTREYTYRRPDGSEVVNQDHSAGHPYNDGGGSVGPHFNVRPPKELRHGTVEGTQPHYLFKR